LRITPALRAVAVSVGTIKKPSEGNQGWWGKSYSKLAASSSKSLAVEICPCLSISRETIRFFNSRPIAFDRYGDKVVGPFP
jgi:hypothetical protein